MKSIARAAKYYSFSRGKLQTIWDFWPSVLLAGDTGARQNMSADESRALLEAQMATLVNIEPGFPRLGLKWFRLQTTSRLPPPGLGFWIWGFVTASCESCLDCSEAFTAVPECVAKGSHLSLEVWRLESCSLSVVLVFATVHSTIAMWSVSLTIGRRSQSDQYEVLEAASRAHSVLACFCCVLRHAWRSRWHFAWQAQSFRRVSM